MTCSQLRRLYHSGFFRLLVFVCGGLGMAVHGESWVQGAPFDGIEARITPVKKVVHPGKPVRVRFSIHNHTNDPFVLAVPGIAARPADVIAELPLSHVFGAAGHGALTVRGDYGRTWNKISGYIEPSEALEIVLGPRAFVGCEVDLLDFLPSFRSPGRYRLLWQPYGGVVMSNEATIEIARLKQAEIVTDGGAMTAELFYERAPKHVANFIELAQNGFYAQKSFHRIEPGFFIQGGCPNRDGTGIRVDGKMLDAEFNDYPIDRGTLVMARLEGDPNSASCQFIITDARLPSWDGKYTAFGHIIGDDSYATLAELMSREADPETGKPRHSVYIRGVRIFDAPAITEFDPPTRGNPRTEINLSRPMTEQVPGYVERDRNETESTPRMTEIPPSDDVAVDDVEITPQTIEPAPRVMELAPPTRISAPAPTPTPKPTPIPMAERIVEMEPVNSEDERTPRLVEPGDGDDIVEMYVAEPEPGDPQ